MILNRKDIFGRDLHIGDIIIEMYKYTDYHSIDIQIILEETETTIRTLVLYYYNIKDFKVSQLKLHNSYISGTVCLVSKELDLTRNEKLEFLNKALYLEHIKNSKTIVNRIKNAIDLI